MMTQRHQQNIRKKEKGQEHQPHKQKDPRNTNSAGLSSILDKFSLGVPSPDTFLSMPRQIRRKTVHQNHILSA